MENFEYSIIMKTFLRPTKLDNCLKAISRQCILPKEVIIADDGGKSLENEKIYNKYKSRLN